MAPRLASYVHVVHNGERLVLGPDDVVPEDVRALITNPKAWVQDDEPEAEQQAVVVGDMPAPPPLHGKGSSRDAWAAYASACGVEVPDGSGRDDIVSILSAADVPTEQAATQ